jgi:hypothetical protein
MDAKALMDQLSPLLLDALGIIGTALLAWIAAAVQKRTNVVKQTESREALHSALSTGAIVGAAAPNASVGQVAKDAVEHAQQSVPDAISLLRPNPTALATLAHAKAVQAMTAQQTMVSKT